MRMLFLSRDTYPPRRVDVSVLFGKELVSRGYKIDWVLQSEDGRTTREKWNAGIVYIGQTDIGVSSLSRLRKHWLGITHDMKSLLRLVRRGRYDVIQVKDKYITAVVAMWLAKMVGARFVFWLSFPFHEEYLYKSTQEGARYPAFYRLRGLLFRGLLRHLLLPNAWHVFVQSDQMKADLLREASVQSDRLTPVPMGVEEEQMLSVTPVDRPPDEQWLVYLGALDKERRIDFLLEVLKEIIEAEPAARLYLVGGSISADDTQYLRDRACQLRVDDAVVITGLIPRKEALAYVAAADVCLSPYYPVSFLQSTSPTKLVEYMALGKPVVCNDHPEQRSLMDYSGGGLCVDYDKNAFVGAVLALLADKAKAREMGVLGRRYVLNHRTYKRIADSVEEVYGRVDARPAVE